MAATLGLRITDGTTTVTLSNGTTGYVMEYVPVNAAAQVETVVERPKVMLLSSLSTVRSTVDSLNQLFRQAKRWQEQHWGSPVYIERQLDTTETTWWRSEIVEANPLPSVDVFDWELSNGKMQFTLAITRKNYWEGGESQVSLTNGNGTDNTSGLTIWNHNDSGSGHDNYVEITAAKVAGDLPAGCRLEVTNSSASVDIDHFYVGHNFTDTTFTTVLEAENSTLGGSNSAGAFSGGYYRTGVSVSGTTETEVFAWTITTGEITAAAGRYFMPLLMPQGVTNPAYYRIKIQTAAAETIYIGKQTYYTLGATASVYSMPVIKLPPWPISATTVTALSLVLTAQFPGGGTNAPKLDWVYLLPLDNYRRYESAKAISNTLRLVDDSIKLETYSDNGSGASRNGAIRVIGSPLYLEPNKLQRLYFYMLDTSGSVNVIDSTATVKLWYRPRRLTLSGG